MSERTTLVFGLGATGYSCIRHLAGRERVLAFDTRAEPPCLDAVRSGYPDVELIAQQDWQSALQQADRLLLSPGVSLEHELVAAARAAGLAIGSDVELFLQAADAPVIGITGTNGKSTVTTLVGELLAASGLDTRTGGNLGVPALDLLAADVDAYVLELSSFQLERLPAPGLAVAAVLNVSADHLDRHADLEAYAASKRRIYGGARRGVFNAQDARTRPPEGTHSIAFNGDARWRVDGDALVVDGCRVPVTELTLRGSHNHANIVAAAAIAHQAGVDVRAQLDVLARFAGLPHRGVLVAQAGDVAYVNDSKATNVGACAAALEGFGDGANNIVLIAGGVGKGAAFEDLAGPVARHVSRLVLLGRDACVLGRALGKTVPAVYAKDMREAVRLAQAAARPGDTVLLSPACASFDMYQNFEARGEDFVAAVAGAAALEGAA